MAFGLNTKHSNLFPFVLAPMASITNAPYRLVMKELGAGVVISELISATGMTFQGVKTLELCKYFEGERPVGLQIFGEDAKDLSEAAKMLQDQGVDFVDINLGCPVPKVVKKGAGSAMCRDPQNLYKVLKAVKDSIQIPLTIKIRTGWDANSINAIECVKAGYEAGVSWVAIHGRTRAQGYEGQANWDLISEVKKQAPIPIIGNGDIVTAKQAVHRLQNSGCDAIMIGRGALRNPFLFLEIKQEMGLPLTEEQKLYLKEDGTWDYWRLIQRHHELLTQLNSPFHIGVQMRKFLTWFSAGFEGAAQFRKELYAVPTDDAQGNEAVYTLAEKFFKRDGLKKTASYLKEPFLQGGHG